MTFCPVPTAGEGATEDPSAGCAFLQSSAFSSASSVEQAQDSRQTICLVYPTTLRDLDSIASIVSSTS